jgi:hypothetical protein
VLMSNAKRCAWMRTRGTQASAQLGAARGAQSKRAADITPHLNVGGVGAVTGMVIALARSHLHRALTAEQRRNAAADDHHHVDVLMSASLAPGPSAAVQLRAD